VCVCVLLGENREQGAVAAVSNRFLQFVPGEQEHTHRDTHRVIIALLPFSRYFVTFAPPHNKENGRAKHRGQMEEERGTGTDLWRGRLMGFQLKYSTRGWQLQGNPFLQL